MKETFLSPPGRIASHWAFILLVLLAIPATTAPVVAASAPNDADGDTIFQLTKLHQIKVNLTAAEWAALQTSNARGGGGTGGTDYTQPNGRVVHVGSGFGGYYPWVYADVRLDGEAFKDVGLRYRGNFSFSSSSAAAPFRANFKLKLDMFGTKGAWDGEKTFNINAGVLDSSRMREAIAFAMFRAAGVPASRTAFTEITFTVPGLYQDAPAGLYTLIENVNKSFLKRALPPGTGLLFKPEGLRGGILSQGDSWASYVRTFRPDRDATPHEQQRLMEFAGLVTQTDVPLFRSKIGTYLDVDEFLRFIAVNVLLANSDSYLGGSHNFYLYLDPKDDKFRFIPWDEDLSLGNRGGGASLLTPATPSQPLIYWLLDDPAVAAKYRAILKELAAKVFTRAALDKMVDEIEKVGSGRGASPRSFLQSRADLLQQQVAGL